MMIIFTSDYEVQESGFTASWSSTALATRSGDNIKGTEAQAARRQGSEVRFHECINVYASLCRFMQR
jgi:hypothetical protein